MGPAISARSASIGPGDALFPKVEVGVRDRRFTRLGLSREPYANAQTIIAVVRGAFAAVGLPEYTPHSFRKTLAMLGDKLCADDGAAEGLVAEPRPRAPRHDRQRLHAGVAGEAGRASETDANPGMTGARSTGRKDCSRCSRMSVAGS